MVYSGRYHRYFDTEEGLTQYDNEQKLANHELRLRNIEKVIYAIHQIRIGGTTLDEEELKQQMFEREE